MSSSENIKAEVLPEDYNQYDLSFKMIVIGDAGVGKSCLTTKASKGIFEETYSATIGFEFLVFNVKLNDKVIKLQIWDTCGQELYRSLISSFYRNASLAMMVYAIDNKESFVIVFSQTECEHCLAYKPKLAKVAKKYKLEVYYLEIDLLDDKKEKELKSYFSFEGTPTTVFVINGEEKTAANRIVGEASEEKIINKLKSNGFID